VHPLEESIEKLAKDVKYFASQCHKKLKQWKNLIKKIEEDGRRAIVWGSGSKCVAFLTTLGVKYEIEYVIDINPYRFGKYLPGVGKMIMPPEFLKDYRPDVTFVMNPIYQDEIQQMLNDMKVTTEIISVE